MKGNGQKTMVLCSSQVGNGVRKRNHIVNINQNISEILGLENGDWNVNVRNEHFFQVRCGAYTKNEMTLESEDFKYGLYHSKILAYLTTIGSWKLERQSRKINTSAFFISNSVISLDFSLSYVARNFLKQLLPFFYSLRKPVIVLSVPIVLDVIMFDPGLFGCKDLAFIVLTSCKNYLSVKH